MTDYGVAVLADGKQHHPTGFVGAGGRRCGFFGAAIAETVTLGVHEKFGISVAVVGIAMVLFIILLVAESYIERIVGIGGVAFGARFAAFTVGVIDDINPASVARAFGYDASVARVPGLRLGATGFN